MATKRLRSSYSVNEDGSVKMLGEDTDGIFRLPVKLKKSQLKGSFVVDKPDCKGQYVYKWETCAICFEPVKGAREGVYLACQKHCFHGSCIVPHLQQDRRCPTCRHAPASREAQAAQAAAEMADEESDGEEGDDSDDESVYEEATNKCAQRLLLGFSLEMLNEALVCYDCPSERSRSKAAEALAEQLLYDTDANEEGNEAHIEYEPTTLYGSRSSPLCVHRSSCLRLKRRHAFQ
eukprot:119837-Prymnesium_polylepis.2